MARIYLIIVLLILLSSCEKTQDINDNMLKFYGDALEDIGYSVAAVDNGYVIGGQFTEVSRTQGNLINDKASVKNMGIIKTGPDGNEIWKKNFGGGLPAVGSKVLTLDDGSVICVGYIIDTLTLLKDKDIFVVKVDAEGTGSIQKTYKPNGDIGNQYGVDIIKTPEGFLILGTTDVERQPLTDSTGNAAGKKDILLLRINNNLEPIVEPTAVGFPGDDEGVALKADMNGGYIVVGTTDRSDNQSLQSGNNIFLLRVNADGSATQPRILGGLDDEYAADIEVLDDGYLIVGTDGIEGPDQRGYVWKVLSDIYAAPPIAKKIEIETTSTTPVSFSIKAMARYKTNSFVMAGQSGIGSSAKMIIFITDSEGTQVAGKKMITGGTGMQSAYDVISDESGNIIAVGKNSYENNSMISLLKFRF